MDKLLSRRILVLSFPNWVTDISAPRVKQGKPFGVYAPAQAGLKLVAVNEPAKEIGLCAGMSVVDARALVPELELQELDTHLIQRSYALCARWASRFTPWVGFDTVPGHYSLVMDISGCAHLFGGERALVEIITNILSRRMISVRAAIANTIGAAWALSHYGAYEHIVLPVGCEYEALLPLPVAALRLPAASLDLCARFGLRQIENVAGIERSALTRRFGKVIVQRLDQAFGQLSEAVNPVVEPPQFRVQNTPLHPLIDMSQVVHYLNDMTAALSNLLSKEGRGAKRLDITLIRTDKARLSFSISMSQPSDLTSHMARLIDDRIERLNLSLDGAYGIDTLWLDAPRTAPMDMGQSHFERIISQSAPKIGYAFSALCDRLVGRLGATHFVRLSPHEDHVPERAVIYQTIFDHRPIENVDAHTPQTRPILLLPQAEVIDVIAEIPEGAPRRFRWRRRLYEIASASGPERISPSWWRTAYGLDVGYTRDYFRLEDREGHRFWLYRDGLYTDETHRPHWYMHGFFA